MGFHNECGYISRTRSSQIYNVVRIVVGDKRISAPLTLETCLLNEFAPLVTGRVFEDCSSMSLWWLYLFAILLMFGYEDAQLLWVFAMQMDAQQHNNFRRL